MPTYNSVEEVEAAIQRGETVDYSQVKGDDGLTDDERRVAKFNLDSVPTEEEGEQPSVGISSSSSDSPTVKSDEAGSKLLPPIVLTTELL